MACVHTMLSCLSDQPAVCVITTSLLPACGQTMLIAAGSNSSELHSVAPEMTADQSLGSSLRVFAAAQSSATLVWLLDVRRMCL